MDAPEFCDRAAELMRERAAQYDKPEGERSMARTVAAFNAVTGRDLPESEGWLFMLLLKQVRQWQQPGKYHADSAEDGVAYSALLAESLKRAEVCAANADPSSSVTPVVTPEDVAFDAMMRDALSSIPADEQPGYWLKVADFRGSLPADKKIVGIYARDGKVIVATERKDGEVMPPIPPTDPVPAATADRRRWVVSAAGWVRGDDPGKRQ